MSRPLRATGDLIMHGMTRRVTLDLRAQHTGAAVRVAGSIPITFADSNIANPSFGPVTTEDHGVLELSLRLAHT